MEYTKPFLTYDEQANLLIKERGLIADHDELVYCLKTVGYYRLSGYWYIYKQPGGDNFIPGTTFKHVWELYKFDQQLRLVVFEATERIEVYMRVQLAHLLAKETGPFGFQDPHNLPRLSIDEYEHFIDRCGRALHRSDEQFAIHFREKYADTHPLPPYWMLANLMDFGMVTTLYRGAPNEICFCIAKELELETKVLESWMITINTIRNICAHHGRLWNRGIGSTPAIPNTKHDPRWHVPYKISGKSIFGILTILNYFLDHISPDALWGTHLLQLIDTLPENDRICMGFDTGWRDCPFWAKAISQL